jgi:hypothetical protein
MASQDAHQALSIVEEPEVAGHNDSPVESLFQTSTVKDSAHKISLLFCLFALPICLSCALVAVISAWTPFEENSESHERGCGPEANSIESVFAPDVTFGNFTISAVRAIDLSWNLLVGRGLQLVLGLSSYRIVTGALLRLAENVPVTYEVIVATVFSTNSLAALGIVAPAIKLVPGFRHKATLIFLLFSAIYVLMLPTLMDISTGYVQNVGNYSILPNNSRILAHECLWVLPLDDEHDGYYCVGHDPGLNTTDIIPNGLRKLDTICVQSTGYQWGFSRPWLLASSLLLMVWSVGVCGMWIDNYQHSEFYNRGMDLGMWKAIADIGSKLQHRLGPRIHEYGDKELRRRVALAPPVKYTYQHDDEGGVGYLELSSRPSEPRNYINTGIVSPSRPNYLSSIRYLEFGLALVEIGVFVWAQVSLRDMPDVTDVNLWLAYTTCGSRSTMIELCCWL